MLQVHCKECDTPLGEAAESIAGSGLVVNHLEQTSCGAGIVTLTCATCQESIDYGPATGLTSEKAALKVCLWELRHEHKQEEMRYDS